MKVLHLSTLTEDEETQLLARRAAVEGWVREFNVVLGASRTPPAVRISAGATYYAPLSNKLVMSMQHLAYLNDADLRLIVAHEMGHFVRRWRSLVAWWAESRLKEEFHADRIALRLTGANVGAWERAMRSVAPLDGLNLDATDFSIRWWRVREIAPMPTRPKPKAKKYLL